MKPKEASADWDEAKIKAENFNSGALNALFCVVTNKEFEKYLQLKLQRKHGPSSRQPLKGLKLSRIQNSKGLLLALRR